MTIPFAQFVLKEIDEWDRGLRLTDGWFNPDYFVDPRRQFGRLGAAEMKDKDDWNLYYDWFPLVGYCGIKISRGPEYVEIKLTREEKKALAKHIDAFFKKAKAKKLEEKNRKKEEASRMQWWP